MATAAVERLRRSLDAHPLVSAVRPHLADAPVYAVGGVVRDGLLGIGAGAEIDLVVVGDALAVAARLADALAAERRLFPRFGTAELTLPAGRIDLVSARREHYPHPGALPEVSPGSLQDDLARRDFTVNAMAIALAGPAPELVDPHGGCRDLEGRRLQTLRPDSFAEDPSRLVRAARYGARLTLSLSEQSARAAAAVAPTLDLGAARVAEEFGRLLDEPSAAAAVALLGRWGVPWVRPDAAERIRALELALATGGAPDLPRWMVRAAGAVEATALAAAALPGWVRSGAGAVAAGWEEADRLGPERPLSQLDELLRRRPPAYGVGALAAGAATVARWWNDARDRQVAIDGDDLRAAGVAPGPAIGRGLLAARAAMLDGGASDAPQQLAAALAAAREMP